MPITETYQSHAEHDPKKIAIQTEAEIIDYQTWYQLVLRTASWLKRKKRMNERLVFSLPNGVPFLQLFAGAAMAGWTAIPFDQRFSLTECSERLSLCKPDLIIAEHPFPGHSNVILLETCLHEIENTPLDPVPHVNDDLPFYIGFTSGSTGSPKAFSRSHQSWIESFHNSSRNFQLSKEDRVVIPGSLFFSHFLYGAMNTLFLGGTIDLLKKFSLTDLEQTIAQQPVTTLYTVPTMTNALSSENRQIDKPVKVISSGANWSKHAKEKLRKKYPSLSLYHFYGTSELSFISVSTPQDDEKKPDSVGLPFHHVEVDIRTSSGKSAKPGEIGKIYVKSPMVFSGYLQEQTDLHSPDENDWMTVHDVGWKDEDGYLYLIGRENSMIVYGGINIYPEEIESVLSSHPHVEEVAVIGVNDDYWGEKAAAVIKGKASVKELKAWCKRQLAHYKTPRIWYFTEQIPHTTSGKIARHLLKQQLKGR
ncbi:AMP-binding protein [Bacillus changyiensis]|uniref:AMP-binding protein n=1 Tax=Bacillus changyiensis TaxID=3004103 RepID=UPI0022E21CA8|nr:AMP-binding protein [Bacillus changyiensis]MDA1475996.1 AMP-binding protein [Bacillus changyiensis]